jgi:hypothetical protein
MILDNNVQDTKMWTGVSEMPFHHIYVHGILKPGKILNRYINTTDEGWNYLYLHNESSVFEFETEEPHTWYHQFLHCQCQNGYYQPQTNFQCR